jgi:acyl-CoA synthetase (AMP-forming)/AMP-acid ligase II
VTGALAVAARSDEGIFFVDAAERERRLSFAEVLDRAHSAAGRLTRAGVQPGDRVALILRTGPAFLDAFFGALCAGAVPVPLYPPLRLVRLHEYGTATARMVAAVGARVVVVEPVLAPLLAAALRRAGGGPWPRVLPAGPRFGRGAAGPTPGWETPSPAAIAVIQFSSGTTHDPLPVALTHANLMAQCAAVQAVLPGLAPPQRGVSWLPLYHDMGLIGCLLAAVYFAGSLVLLPPEVFLAHPALWLRAIARHRATISPAPDFAYALAAQRVPDQALAGHDLSSWRYALDGAEPIVPATQARFAARFSRFGFDARAFLPVYGLAEAALAVTFPPPGRPVQTLRLESSGREVVSVGTPLPGVELEVRDRRGALLADGRIGRIFVRGPTIMRCYFGAPTATARTLQGGWLDTGDLGLVKGGELYVCGRAKDVIIIRGVNHAPQEFEQAVAGMAGLRAGSAAAVGLPPDSSLGERLAMLCETKGDAPPDLARHVERAVLERTSVRPDRVVLLAPGALPRTSSGKLRRAEALRRYLAGTLVPPRRSGRLGLLGELARLVLPLRWEAHERT